VTAWAGKHGDHRVLGGRGGVGGSCVDLAGDEDTAGLPVPELGPVLNLGRAMVDRGQRQVRDQQMGNGETQRS